MDMYHSDAGKGSVQITLNIQHTLLYIFCNFNISTSNFNSAAY